MNRCLDKIKNGTDEEKAIYLTWLCHLVGDIHQPLHCVALFSDKYPNGDKGGNAIRIRIASSPTNLHSFWDGLLGRGVTAGNIGKDVEEIQHVLREKTESLKPDPDLRANTTPESWAKEGARIARHAVYLDGELLKARDDGEGVLQAPAGYAPFCGMFAREQIGKAGIRLAEQFRSLSADSLMEDFSSATSFWQAGEVARKLVALGDKRIIPMMEKHLETKDRRSRCNAALVLAGLGDKRGLATIIREFEDLGPRPTSLVRCDGKPDIDGQIKADRYYAALLLGQLRMRESVPALIKATTDETVNYRVAISLGEIGDKSAIPALAKMVKDCPAQRLWAGYGLAALGEPEGFDLLTNVALSDSNWTDRRHAVEALGTIGDPRAVPTVVKALKDKHPNVKVSAAHALGKIGDPSALPALNEALRDSDATVVNSPTTVQSEAPKAIEAIKEKRK